ncbi:hypothetical protein DFH09DRAFT_1288149 [Mycena vulgaris]|nr:hypothetical protein DFH09DRAFT_1288149 [Mycena vulgaris]
MHPTTSLHDLLEHTKFAASVVQDISHAQSIPGLAAAAAASMQLCELGEEKTGSIQPVVESTHKILCGIIGIHTRSGDMSDVVLEDVTIFEATLEKLCVVMESGQKPNRVKGLFKRRERVNQINACEGELRRILQRLEPNIEDAPGPISRGSPTGSAYSGRQQLSTHPAAMVYLRLSCGFRKGLYSLHCRS